MPDATWPVSPSASTQTQPRVAIIHEWLETYAGSERVLREILGLFPQADLFAVVDVLTAEDRAKLWGKTARVSFIQRLPFAKKRFRGYLALMPLAIEQFDLSGYELVISSNHAVAKGVLTGPGQIHICYCHTPIRYAWDLQHQYLREAGLTKGIKTIFARALLHYIRLWDTRTASGVDQFVANSSYVARRIRKIYGRDARVIHPPVDVEAFAVHAQKDDFYLTASRLVPYKRIDLIVAAFKLLPERRLVVIGDGPELAKIQKLAGHNVTLLGYQNDAVLLDHLQRARAFIFAAEEDFGILPVEAQACGTPVIAYGYGGARDSIIGTDMAGSTARTGLFFYEQSAAAIGAAVNEFEMMAISPAACRAQSEKFSTTRFRSRFAALADDLLKSDGVLSGPDA
jgi:glycosyltransferase involved in cell wall biosynthesis